MSQSVSDITQAVSGRSADALLEALDPEQRAVATALHGPVVVMAGAGTGKTRAITHRIAYGVRTGTYDPARVLAVTFTQRAAGEMRGRLAQLGANGVQARTFHSAALRQAKWFWPKVFGGELPPIIDRKFPLLTEAASRCRVRVDTPALRDLAGEVEWAKVSNVRPDDYARVAPQSARALAAFDPATIARVFAAYEDVKLERGRIDLEDVLLCAVALLAEDERVAAEIRRQYRTFVVDEYQDVSPLQQSLLDLWLGGREDVCVVGDPAQTIYSWAGADPENLVRFAQRHPTAAVIKLVRDYRSTPQIVDVANKVLDAAGPSGLPGRVTLRSQREAGPAPVYREYSDEVAEADAVARAIARLRDSGTALRDIAVLFRTNAQSENFEQALAERKIPAMLKGAERFFERAEIRQAAVLLRGQAKAGDTDGVDLLDTIKGILAGAGWTEEPPAGTGAVRDRWESLSALVTMASDFAAANPEAGIVALMAELDRRASIQHAPLAEGVTLATLHAAKGLEWGCVFIVGAHEGTLPISYAQTPAQVEEERRLFYVGVTRAKDQLSISWSTSRSPGGRGTRGPTRFLDPIGVRTSRTSEWEPSSRTRGAGRAERSDKPIPKCRVCGRGLTEPAARKLGRCEDCPSSMDQDLYDALFAWRAERAAEESLPAFVIFTDATLTAIAETRPADERELLRIPGIGRIKVSKYGEPVINICTR
ncbi:DNA helicase-2/ATP-dependent DNA helicase PcrA [Kribbella orskensis]|uniref:DNA 3'-5' helicase n=1 Tax=Kribbella orskensis TaxID=2512216 RepID=A0ABY2BCW0_9ACTN|nr:MULTISPECIES: ATP-dependent DNA helicase UvrD2 [Kribbella]TCN34918.1 DNA helicase-2/ATP-dependent DNA helicase PcrA [Kribbella sp. VKM Ac-2500]TCO15624.1 DNA helicase-2/ATP-dependent DNA helicase PcrA [Kribbella orskensis]